MATIEAGFRTIIKQLQREKRWGDLRFPPGMTERKFLIKQKLITRVHQLMKLVGLSLPPGESVFEHMFKQNMVVLKMLAYEDIADNPFNLDYFEIFRCSATHDIGEGGTLNGDIPVPDKTDADDDDEAEAYERIIAELVEEGIRYFFPQPLDRSGAEGDVNRIFWEASEVIGYLVYAVHQRETDARYQRVIDYHMPLSEEMMQFSSVRKMLSRMGLS